MHLRAKKPTTNAASVELAGLPPRQTFQEGFAVKTHECLGPSGLSPILPAPQQPQDLLQVQAEAGSNAVRSSGSSVLGDIGRGSQPLRAATFEILLLWNLGHSWPLGIREGLKPAMSNRARLPLFCPGLAPTPEARTPRSGPAQVGMVRSKRLAVFAERTSPGPEHQAGAGIAPGVCRSQGRLVAYTDLRHSPRDGPCVPRAAPGF